MPKVVPLAGTLRIPLYLPAGCRLAPVHPEPPHALAAMLNAVFVGGLPREPEARLLTFNFVRLVDAAVHEYEQAALVLRENRGTGKTSLFLRFSAHLENCVSTASRACQTLGLLKRRRAAPVLPRTPRKRVEAEAPAIRKVRNIVEHMAECIASGKVPNGEAPFPRVDADGKSFRIAGRELDFERLARMLRYLSALAKDAAVFREAEMSSNKAFQRTSGRWIRFGPLAAEPACLDRHVHPAAPSHD